MPFLSKNKISRPWSYGRIHSILQHHWPKSINIIPSSQPQQDAKLWSQPIRESDLGCCWHSWQQKPKKLLLKPVLFRGISLPKSIQEYTILPNERQEKEGKNKMTLDEASIANLPNINTIFYSVGEKKSWQNMKRKIVWLIMRFSYENIFVIFVIWSVAVESALYKNISILLEEKSHLWIRIT